MKIFDTIAKLGHEQLVLCADESAGYRGIIAIHDTTLGPALGGTRVWNVMDTVAYTADIWDPATGQWTIGAAAVRARLEAAYAAAIQDPTVRSRLEAIGYDPARDAPGEFARAIRQDRLAARAIMRVAGSAAPRAR